MNELEHCEAFFVGLKLGRVGDPSALALLARRLELPPIPEGTIRAPGLQNATSVYYCPFLQLFPAGTAYHLIVAEAVRLWNLQELAIAKRFMIADQSGVGSAGLDGLRRTHHIPVTGVVITGGEAIGEKPGELRLPKSEILTLLVNTVQIGRLKLLPGGEHEKAFFEQLQNLTYRVKRDKQQTIYESEEPEIGEELTLAMALPLWYAEHRIPSSIGRRKSHVAPKYNPFSRQQYVE